MANWFDTDLTLAQAERSLSNTDLAKFHTHNPNGVMAEWSALSRRLLDFGRGFLAYGDTGYYYGEMIRLTGLTRVNRIGLQSTVKGIRRTIANGEAFLAEQGAAA